eukprot:505332-Pleurochrysis_carterae.AAC.1
MCAQRRCPERAVRARKQLRGVCGSGTCTTGGERGHHCRLLCASRASSLAWEWRACRRRGWACCSYSHSRRCVGESGHRRPGQVGGIRRSRIN